MLKFFRDLLTDENNQNNYSHDSETYRTHTSRKLELATCALFLEVAQSDEHYEKSEREQIVAAMKSLFTLSEKEITELMKQSDEQVRESVSLYEFTDVINHYFDKDQKYEVIKNLWRLIFADEKISKYEEHFIRTINNNFHLEHNDLIASKMEVKKELGIE